MQIRQNDSLFDWLVILVTHQVFLLRFQVEQSYRLPSLLFFTFIQAYSSAHEVLRLDTRGDIKSTLITMQIKDLLVALIGCVGLVNAAAIRYV